MRNWIATAIIAALCILNLLNPSQVSAHGVDINYSSEVEITITARYDTGEPMSEGQVTIYAPDNPTTPWLTGKCDSLGRFSFKPDISKPGIWDIQVRLAGHGSMIHIPVGESAAASGGVGGYSYLQIGLMAACVIWGSIGTALYFKRRQSA